MTTVTTEQATVHVVTTGDGRRFRRLTRRAACRAAARAVVRAACECEDGELDTGYPGTTCYLHRVADDGTRRLDVLVDRLARLYAAAGRKARRP
jgi:hypothetical protein